MTNLLTVKQFAEKTGVSRQAINKSIASGRIKARRIGCYYVIESSELSRWAILPYTAHNRLIRLRVKKARPQDTQIPDQL